MDKILIHRLFVEKLEASHASLMEAARASYETATDAEHKARSKYETFSLESSYLARGQAARVEELSDSLERLRVLPLKAFAADDGAALGALVVFKPAGGDEQTVLLCASAGGEEIELEGRTIRLIQITSPLGQSLRGKAAGASFRIGANSSSILSVS